MASVAKLARAAGEGEAVAVRALGREASAMDCMKEEC